MKSTSVILATAMMALTWSTQARSAEACFHGWLPTEGNDSVTGICWNRRIDPDVSTDIQINADSQAINIQGMLGWGPEGGRYEGFDYATISCVDESESVTVVDGLNNRGEAFRMTFEKVIYAEVPSEDYVAGHARIQLTQNGQKYDLTMPCFKHGGTP